MKPRRKKSHKKKPSKSQVGELTLRNGEQALASGRYDEAISYFSKISSDSPEYGRACKGRGAALLKLRRWSEALGVLQTAHELLPGDPDILVDAGDGTRILGNTKVAEM